MNGRTMIYLSRADVERAGVTVAGIVRSLEEMFREKAAGNTDMPPKTAVYPGPPESGAFVNAMPALLPGAGLAGIKWVASSPGNLERGLPSISALMILNDAETGLPVCVMDASWITAKRTAAASVVAAKRLARPDSEILAVVGCGVQGFEHAEALRTAFRLRRVRAFDVRREAAAAFAFRIRESSDLEVDVFESAEEAVRGGDIIATAGTIFKEPRPVLGLNEFAPGTFVTAVDYDSSWTGEAMAAADLFVMDDLAQMRAFRDRGYFRGLPERIGELADLVSGRIPGRTKPEERTMAMNMGIALDDLAAARLVLEKARALGLGLELPL
ncbi:MAG: ornithine cyclodeaminase family protein [Candidatus Aminicenantes bacterium]|nr:ornithine cyclodeaminase family protein [Candidatus Aminicenantes bacterium]